MLIIGTKIDGEEGPAAAAMEAAGFNANTFFFDSRDKEGVSCMETGRWKEVYKGDKDRLSDKGRSFISLHSLMVQVPKTLTVPKNAEGDKRFQQIIGEDMERISSIKIPYLSVSPDFGSACFEAERWLGFVKSGLAGTRGTLLLEAGMNSAARPLEEGRGMRFPVLEQLKLILEGSGEKKRIGVCLDLCGLYAAGYDLKDDSRRVLRKIDEVVSLDYVKAVRISDSIYPLGSGKTGRVPVGRGRLGEAAVARLLRHPYLRALPFYLDTPGNKEDRRAEIWNLRKLCRSGIRLSDPTVRSLR